MSRILNERKASLFNIVVTNEKVMYKNELQLYYTLRSKRASNSFVRKIEEEEDTYDEIYEIQPEIKENTEIIPTNSKLNWQEFLKSIQPCTWQDFLRQPVPLTDWKNVLRETMKSNRDILLEYFPGVLAETIDPLLEFFDGDEVEASCWLIKRGWMMKEKGKYWLSERINNSKLYDNHKKIVSQIVVY